MLRSDVLGVSENPVDFFLDGSQALPQKLTEIRCSLDLCKERVDIHCPRLKFPYDCLKFFKGLLIGEVRREHDALSPHL